jgi:hypothetical protein
VATPPIPVKTADGHAELSNRRRGLGQRHRTVLLLVDGRRSEQQVRTLASQAGAGERCFGELLELGLIAMPQPPDTLPTIPIPRPPPSEEPPLHVDIPIEPLPVPVPRPAPPTPPGAAFSGEDLDSLMPAARTLQPESVLGDLTPASESLLEDFDVLEAATGDVALEEARGILLHAVRKEAPLAGSFTILRLRRARTRDDLAQLMSEVESHIIKPYRSLAAQQVLRRVRHLLSATTDTALPAF